MICDKCGKEMSDEHGTMIGLSIMVNRNGIDGHTDEFLDKQLGKYAGNDHYEFCYECLIDAVMGDKNINSRV